MTVICAVLEVLGAFVSGSATASDIPFTDRQISASERLAGWEGDAVRRTLRAACLSYA